MYVRGVGGEAACAGARAGGVDACALKHVSGCGGAHAEGGMRAVVLLVEDPTGGRHEGACVCEGE